jgi:hypothetical protein
LIIIGLSPEQIATLFELMNRQAAAQQETAEALRSINATLETVNQIPTKFAGGIVGEPQEEEPAP